MSQSPGNGLPPVNAEAGGHEEAAMRRTTLQKPLRKPDSRRPRDESEERPAQRPEVRKDIRRTWWPDG
ncbi:hypothetical protein GCM10010515_16820 [Streptomyces fructofermentans]|uniref:Uncharacterized protein n=1 Tax=Streptomyces fructofermentans TaxID=152141 RepID=A0A918K6T9_9ACTN|nr:hypothetical protein GCM10010515_16820 [Streptomyces fructofermentans]